MAQSLTGSCKGSALLAASCSPSAGCDRGSRSVSGRSWRRCASRPGRASRPRSTTVRAVGLDLRGVGGGPPDRVRAGLFAPVGYARLSSRAAEQSLDNPRNLVRQVCQTPWRGGALRGINDWLERRSLEVADLRSMARPTNARWIVSHLRSRRPSAGGPHKTSTCTRGV